MTHPLPAILESFAGLRAVVVGEAMLDRYLAGRAERIGREAPVPIVALSERREAPGGAGNAAANVAALGAAVTLVSAVGDDPEAARLADSLGRIGVDDAGLLRVPGRTTLAKTRVSAGEHMLVRFDDGSVDPLDRETEASLERRLRDAVRGADLLILSDYDYGILSDSLLAPIAAIRREQPLTLVVDARDLRRYRPLRPDAVKPNYDEALRLLGEPEARDRRARVRQIEPHGPAILALTGARVAAVTFDTEGALVLEAGQPSYRTYARPHSHSRAAGAGDTYMAALGLALAAGADTPAAAEIAATAAAVVVEKDGTACCSLDELARRIRVSEKRVDRVEQLAGRVSDYRREGRRVVFTNGCFDILHRGHVTYLTRAKALGDVLVVGVNSDAGVSRLKGPGRPINPLDDRLAVLEALSCVDHVIPFEQDTPVALIEAIRPDVYTKGGDYRPEQLPEAAVVEGYGGSVEILPYLEDRSTTGLIERVQRGGVHPIPGVRARRTTPAGRIPA